MKNILSTKNIIKSIVILNICFILGLLFSAVLGNVLSTGQTKAAAFCILIIFCCVAYKKVELEN